LTQRTRKFWECSDMIHFHRLCPWIDTNHAMHVKLTDGELHNRYAKGQLCSCALQCVRRLKAKK
jgi:hypothetical protein